MEGCDDVEWIYLSQDRDKFLALVNISNNFKKFPEFAGIMYRNSFE